MTHSVNVIRLAVVVTGLGLISCQTVAPRAEAGASVRQRLAQFDRDATAGKFDAMMTLFAPDVALFSSGQPPVVGKSSVASFWTSFLEQFNVREAEHQIVEVTEFGDAVVVRGRALGTWDPKAGGPPLITDNWFLHIYKRQADGSFRLWRGAFGANAAGSATPK